MQIFATTIIHHYKTYHQLQQTWNLFWLFLLAFRMSAMLCADLTGTVLFSTTILLPRATWAISRATDSTYLRSAARPW